MESISTSCCKFTQKIYNSKENTNFFFKMFSFFSFLCFLPPKMGENPCFFDWILLASDEIYKKQNPLQVIGSKPTLR